MEMKVCAVCIDEIEVSSNNFKTVCEHEFHIKCLLDWLMKNETCPSCRKVILKPKVVEAAVNNFFAEKPDLSSFNKKELFELLEFLFDFEEYSFENVFERLDFIGWDEEEWSDIFQKACSKGHLNAA